MIAVLVVPRLVMMFMWLSLLVVVVGSERDPGFPGPRSMPSEVGDLDDFLSVETDTLNQFRPRKRLVNNRKHVVSRRVSYARTLALPRLWGWLEIIYSESGVMRKH